jgi:hypothetical protein
MRQETGRERYYRQVREIRDELGVSHNEARERWSDYYAPGGDRIKPIKSIQLSIRASLSNQRTCPFCRDSIYHPDEGGPDYVCTNCQAHYHLDCFEDELGGRCATLGCSTRRVISRARTRIRARGRTPRAVTPETPVTRAHEDGATAQELDPEDYGVPVSGRATAQAPQEAARDVQEPERAQEPTTRWESPTDRLVEWWEGSRFRESLSEQGPILIGLGVLLLLVFLACWAYVAVIAS